MKKILIMMALIVGFGVSAQKDTKIVNLQVNYNGDIVFNAVRAHWVDMQKGFGNERSWFAVKAAEEGEPYVIPLDKSHNDRIYRIRARRHHANGGNGVSFEQTKEVRVIKVLESILNPYNGGTSIQLTVEKPISDALIGQRMFMGTDKIKVTFAGGFVDPLDGKNKLIFDINQEGYVGKISWVWFKKNLSNPIGNNSEEYYGPGLTATKNVIKFIVVDRFSLKEKAENSLILKFRKKLPNDLNGKVVYIGYDMLRGTIVEAKDNELTIEFDNLPDDIIPVLKDDMARYKERRVYIYFK